MVESGLEGTVQENYMFTLEAPVTVEDCRGVMAEVQSLMTQLNGTEKDGGNLSEILAGLLAARRGLQRQASKKQRQKRSI